MKNNYKFWIILSLIVVFSAGVAGGILFENYFLDKRPKKREERRSPVRFPTMEMMADELGLTTDQQEKIRDVFRNNEERLKQYRSQIHQQYSSLRTQLKKEIEDILTEEQKTKFQAMIDKYLSERKRQMEERNKRSEGSQRNRGERR
jgi:Spy/CpxP family protein refolding chaperone